MSAPFMTIPHPGRTHAYVRGAMTQHFLNLMLAIWGVLPQIAIGALLALWLTKA